jgi:hypothetical protein
LKIRAKKIFMDAEAFSSTYLDVVFYSIFGKHVDTRGLLLAPFKLPARCALTQLPKVCSTTPKLRAAAAWLWPGSTSRTASCLNSSV